MAIALPFVLISCSDDKDEPENPKEHEWVDLGLPSGTLWATCNIGANRPEEYGDYFAWGEVSPKKAYSHDNYKWSDYSKYNETDNKTELEPEEVDENGVGRTLTCIGFKPLPDEIAWQISKKFQLYH